MTPHATRQERGRAAAGRARARRGGFTLLELLVASVIAAVLGLAAASLLRVLHQAGERVAEAGAARAVRGAVLRRLEADLRAVLPPGGLYASGIVVQAAPGLTAGGEALLPADLAAALEGSTPWPEAEPWPVAARDQLTLATLPAARAFGREAPPGEGAIWSVIWEIDEDPATPERGLVRRPTRVRDPVTGAEPEPTEAVCAEVVGLEVRCFDGESWLETWDSGAVDSLPRLVRVRAVLARGGEAELLVLEVAPPAAWTDQSTATAAAQAAGGQAAGGQAAGGQAAGGQAAGGQAAGGQAAGGGGGR